MHSKYRRRKEAALVRLSIIPSITKQMINDAVFTQRRGEKPDYRISYKGRFDAKDIHDRNARRAWELVRLQNLLQAAS